MSIIFVNFSMNFFHNEFYLPINKDFRKIVAGQGRSLVRLATARAGETSRSGLNFFQGLWYTHFAKSFDRRFLDQRMVWRVWNAHAEEE
jgi:hypothetical protein